MRSQPHPDTIGLLTDEEEEEEEFIEEEADEEEGVTTEGKEGRSSALVPSLVGMPGYTLPGCVSSDYHYYLHPLLLLHVRVCVCVHICMSAHCSGVPCRGPRLASWIFQITLHCTH